MTKVLTRIYLQDEAPTLGSGWREVAITEGRDRVRIKDPRTGATKSFSTKVWAKLNLVAESHKRLAQEVKPVKPSVIYPEAFEPEPVKAAKLPKVAKPATEGTKKVPMWKTFADAVRAAGDTGIRFADLLLLFPGKSADTINCLPEAANVHLKAEGVKIVRVKDKERTIKLVGV